MKHYLVLLVLLSVVFLSAWANNPDAAIATAFPSPRAAVETIIATGVSTPEAIISTFIATVHPVVTQSTTFVCAFEVHGCPGGKPEPFEECFIYYEIAEGTYMTDASCDALVTTIQAGLNKIPGENGPAAAIRVYSYPTTPIICSKAFSEHSTLTIVDPARSEASQNLCNSLP